MPSSPKFNVNGFGFIFNCNFGYDAAANGVVVHQSADMLDDEDFREALKLALEIYPAVNATYTLTETLLNAGSYEDYPELYHLAYSSRDFDPTEILKRALQERVESEALSLSIRKKKQTRGFVYLVQGNNGTYKIGRTKDPANRAKTFSVQLPFEIEFLALIETEDMMMLETALHGQFAAKRVNGEWFSLTPDDVEYIKSLQE